MGPGDRLLTLLPNTPATFAIGLAAMLEGVVQVALPADLRRPEIATIAEDAAPIAALVGPGVESPPDVPTHVLDEAVLDRATERPPSADWPRTRPMAYTSGTIGRRKGVYVGVHEPPWGEVVVRDELDAFERRHGDRHLVVSPLYHSGPFRFAAVTVLMGGRVAILPSFDADEFRSALRSLRPTSLFCVPTHLQRLLALPDLQADDLASLQLLAHAGAPCPVPLKERVLELAPDGSVWEFYGSTEGQFTVCPPELWHRSPGTVGIARPGRRLELRDVTDDGVGTVWVTAPWHARWEYWRDPVKTAAAWDGDAFTVGDLGHFDGDLLHLDGRPGDLVITGGVNVYPAEVEAALRRLDGIAEAVVFGVPDEEWGERLVAAVTPEGDADPDPAALARALRKALAPAKVPKQINVIDELPRTSTGKVRRTDLADLL